VGGVVAAPASIRRSINNQPPVVARSGGQRGL